MIRRSDVDKERGLHRFIPGKGYRRAPPLVLPRERAAEAGVCEPAQGAPDKSVHSLVPPAERDAQPLEFLWHADAHEWEPLGRSGKRVAFSSAYLAAHGWSYVGPV